MTAPMLRESRMARVFRALNPLRDDFADVALDEPMFGSR
jgi:hypothetical protein